MKAYRVHILIFVTSLCILALVLVDPVAQDIAYHNFADQRKILGIPNFWDVVSNLPMFFVGVWGLYFSLKNYKLRPGFVAKTLPLLLCLGIASACFGSAYYHWAPDNVGLAWDRLPMVIMFMTIFTLVIYDFIDKRFGSIMFFILVPLGLFSIIYWQYTESIGAGDLRPYAFVQFYPMIIAPFILILYPKKVGYLKYILFVLAWYIVAKISEYYDPQIYEFTGFWSGHTIKHLVSGISLFYVVKFIMAWEKELLVN